MQHAWCRYNTEEAALYGYNAGTAIYATGTFTANPQGPYSLVMQTVGCACEPTDNARCKRRKLSLQCPVATGFPLSSCMLTCGLFRV